ncbi:unnamed protein product, partial [Ixodes persulcatus]
RHPHRFEKALSLGPRLASCRLSRQPLACLLASHPQPFAPEATRTAVSVVPVTKQSGDHRRWFGLRKKKKRRKKLPAIAPVPYPSFRQSSTTADRRLFGCGDFGVSIAAIRPPSKRKRLMSVRSRSSLCLPGFLSVG